MSDLIIELNPKRYLRVWRGLLHYTLSLVFYLIGESEHQERRILSASPSYYYGAFHLALATYILHPKSNFEVESWFRLAGSKEPYRWRIPLGHKKLVFEIRKLPAGDNDFLVMVSDFLDESRDMREFSHYGPYIEISDNPKPSHGSIYLPFRFDFIGHIFEKELGQLPQKEIGENNKKLKVMYMKLYKNFETLLDRFSEYFAFNYGDHSWDVRLVILHLPYFALWACLYIPHETFERLNAKLDDFVKRLGDWYYEAYSKAKEMKTYTEPYLGIKEGSQSIFSLY